jgi:hypothetical protein
LNDPMVTGVLYTAGQSGVTGRKEGPAFGCGEDSAITGSDGVRRGAGGEGVVNVAIPFGCHDSLPLLAL